VRPAAEVDEFAVAIEADLVAGLGEFGHEVGLHEVAVALEFRQRLLARLVFADKLLVARHHLGHLGFDGGQVLGREGLLAIEVVEEAGIGGRTVAELGLGKQLEHRRGQHVRGRVAHHLQRLGVVLLHQLQRVSAVSGVVRSTRRGAARPRRHTSRLRPARRRR
jgi:hypothetical protein